MLPARVQRGVSRGHRATEGLRVTPVRGRRAGLERLTDMIGSCVGNGERSAASRYNYSSEPGSVRRADRGARARRGSGARDHRVGQGSTPQRVGAKMLVFADGRTVGTIGGGCYENDAFWKARGSIQSRKPSAGQVRAERRLRAGERPGCGGQMEVYIEPVEPSPRLYVIGAGHVGYHLGALAHAIGFRMHVARRPREVREHASAFPTPTKSSSRHSRHGCIAPSFRPTPTPSS